MTQRRLVVLLDGTWKAADDGAIASNVVRLMRLLRHQDDAGVEQIVYYDKGVGTGGRIDRLLGGGLGHGLEANIRDAYMWLGNNYLEGDEIHIFGFSRGAYTARSLAGFIGACGLLDRSGMGRVKWAWDLYRARDSGAKGKLGTKEQLIACVGVWDTVGALGIPLGPLNPFKRQKQFHDTSLGAHIDCALHAMAADEKRGPFAPTLWEKEIGAKLPHKQVVEQVWFAGAHSDIGGGYGDWALSTLTLDWMASRIEAHTFLRLHKNWRDLLKKDLHECGRTFENASLGTLHESRSILYTFSRILPFQRIIGNQAAWARPFRRLKPKENNEFVNEAIHRSVLDRFGKQALFQGTLQSMRDRLPKRFRKPVLATPGGLARSRLYKPPNVRAAKEAGPRVVPVVERE